MSLIDEKKEDGVIYDATYARLIGYEQSKCEILIKAGKHVEELYAITKNVLDKNFKNEIKQKFYPRYAEMYCAATLMVKYNLDVTHKSDKGPDFLLEKSRCWVEVVAVSDGDPNNPNSVKKLTPGTQQAHFANNAILRFSSVFVKKSNKIKCDIQKGIVSPTDPVIIFISGCHMTEGPPFFLPKGGLPHIVSAVLPVGELVLRVNTQTKEGSWEYRYCPGVNKKTEEGDELIKMDYFLTECHSHISAIIYSYAKADNAPSRDKWGDDFITIYNPMAKNPLPLDLIKCADQYFTSIEDDVFTIRKKC